MHIKFFKQLSKKDTEIAGGKGASLGEMAQAGFSVPSGFVVSSEAFNDFLKETDLLQEIKAALEKVDIKEMHTIENASEKIQAMILGKSMPADIEKEILRNFKKLGARFVAVRSSATAEDSAQAAWAGQLESYLNTTEKTLLENVKKCWASLFTPRAIFYRFEKGFHKSRISVAVVIQKMVNSEKSGIAFSVHPVTQDDNQLIIEAGFGLGEAIVSGQITPDSYVVDKRGYKILDININEQGKALYRKNSGGNIWKKIGEKGKRQVLSEKEIVKLSKLIVKIENHYGFPCDIEWAKEKGKFYVTQSRPITTLKKNEKNYTDQYMDADYERVFGGPGMPFLTSDFAAETYIKNYHFFITKIDNIWTCYMPLQKKRKTLAEGKRIFEDPVKYKKYKSDYLNFIREYPGRFRAIISGNRPITSVDFKRFIKLCQISENYYGNTEYFVTDTVAASREFEKDFGNLKIKGRALLNKQYFSKNNYLERVLRKVSSTTGISFSSLYFYKWQEIAALLSGKKIKNPHKKKRLTFITYLDGRKKVTLTGEKARKKILIFQNKHKKRLSDLSGTIANRGKIIGLARILDQGYEHKKLSRFLGEMKKGEILIAETTSPEIITACKKAAAIITNQGGLMSHAAIISRELDIPCIVGVEGATTELKDGDLIEVDAEKGVVKILKKT